MKKIGRYEVLNSDKLTPKSKYVLIFDTVYGIVFKDAILDFGDEQDE